jgi:hypothetical protein
METTPIAAQPAHGAVVASNPANTVIETKIIVPRFVREKSGWRDSNPRHQAWEACTLPLSYTRIRWKHDEYESPSGGTLPRIEAQHKVCELDARDWGKMNDRPLRAALVSCRR